MTSSASESPQRRALEIMVGEVLRALRLEYNAVTIVVPTHDMFVVHLADPSSSTSPKTLEISVPHAGLTDDAIRTEVTRQIVKKTMRAPADNASDPDPRD